MHQGLVVGDALDARGLLQGPPNPIDPNPAPDATLTGMLDKPSHNTGVPRHYRGGQAGGRGDPLQRRSGRHGPDAGSLAASPVRDWRDSFQAMTALQPKVIIPGHGHPGDLAKAQRDTGGYLDWLVREVESSLANREPIDEAVERLAQARLSSTWSTSRAGTGTMSIRPICNWRPIERSW